VDLWQRAWRLKLLFIRIQANAIIMGNFSIKHDIPEVHDLIAVASVDDQEIGDEVAKVYGAFHIFIAGVENMLQ
jgi:hypothetical protein